MNRHIEKFKKAANLDNVDQQKLNIFAQMIVEECARVADCRSSFNHNSGSKILKYFDIEYDTL